MTHPAVPPDLMDFTPLNRADVQIFNYGQGGQGWQTWAKPRGVTMTYMIAIAGGGGGGGGFAAAAASARGGGGGGACSGIARLMVPSFLLPDVLFVQVGSGGQGVTTGAGGNGANSFVSYGHTAVIPNLLLASGVNAPGGGGTGTGAAVGTAGTIPTIATTNVSHFIGQWFATVGIIGTAGGAVAGGNGTSVTAWAGLPMTPGASGAGTTSADFVGGAVTATAAADFGIVNFPNTAGWLAAGGLGGGGNGNPGVCLWKPFFMTGGSGGGSSNTGKGGDGGKGGIGCGGGGGGAGVSAGRGGDGGNGLVMIISW